MPLIDEILSIDAIAAREHRRLVRVGVPYVHDWPELAKKARIRDEQPDGLGGRQATIYGCKGPIELRAVYGFDRIYDIRDEQYVREEANQQPRSRGCCGGSENS